MFKVRFKERLFIIFFACFLAIYPPTVKYQEVQALEWAIPTVAFDTALKFLLGLLGVSITSKALHDNVDWNQVQQDAMNYQIQKGNDAVAVGEWWEDVAKGTLNQASACWSAFKEWVKNQIAIGGGGLSYNDFITRVNSLSNYNFNISNSALLDGYSISSVLLVNDNGFSTVYVSKNLIEFTRINNTLKFVIDDYYVANSNDNEWVYHSFLSGSVLGSSSRISYILPYSVEGTYIRSFLNDDGIFDSANDNVTDTAITTDDTTTTAIPGALPLPWDNVSDTAEGVSDAIDALQEQVAEGVLSLEEYWERVQELVNALAIDTTTEETLPVTQNPDTGESEKLPDKVDENVSNVGFTLSGLEKVFPFCIPWDIYGFVTLLVAEPIAPVINYPIYNPITDSNINISIDFSDWETVVVLFRYILDFLLIIGLLLLARQLSGAGGDD